MSEMLDRILDGESLSESEASALMHELAAGEMAPALGGALLAGLRAKGETADEIRGFALAMRELALHPEIPDGAARSTSPIAHCVMTSLLPLTRCNGTY